MELRKVYPATRFAVPNSRIASIPVLLKTNKYYCCPHCDNKTLIRYQEVSPFAKNKTPLDFDSQTLHLFDEMGTLMPNPIGDDRTLFAYDFYCAGCGSPVRLIYNEYEQGMGGKWFAAIYQIVERENKTNAR